MNGLDPWAAGIVPALAAGWQLLGGALMPMARRLRHTMTARHAKRLYLYPWLYPALLFVAMMVDSAVRL